MQEKKEQIATPVSNSVADACRRLGVGRTTLYELIAARELLTFKLGQRTLIPESELQRFVAERMGVAA